MPDEINFVDLVALKKIGPDTTVEKYGGLINSSLFDAANVLGSLNQKGLISFTNSLPGQNPITITDTGNMLLIEANEKASGSPDALDTEVLAQIANGSKTPMEVGNSINIRPKDLAMHLYKLSKQGYVIYEFRSGSLRLMLTENGFTYAKTGKPVGPSAAIQQAAPHVAVPPGMVSQPKPVVRNMPVPTSSPGGSALVQQPQQSQALMTEPQRPPQPEQSQGQAPMQGSPQPPEEPPAPEKPLSPEDLEARIKESKAQRRRTRLYVIIAAIVIVVVLLYVFNVI